MKIKCNVPGKKRKELAQAISDWLGKEVKYSGAPTFAYTVDDFTIEKDGTLSFDAGADSEVIERLLQHLYDVYDEGFDIDQSHPEKDEQQPSGISIQMPMLSEAAIANLYALIEAKGALIKKAIGASDLPIEEINDRLDFPWFAEGSTPEELHAYMNLVTKLCQMATSQMRVHAKEQIVDNEKYAFRCFLLRLGFIGNEYKADRKILLRNFTGSSAFKSNRESEVNG